MIPFVLRYWRTFAALAFCAALWVHGYGVGKDRCEARHLAAENSALRAAFRAAEAASMKEAARLEAEAAREALARELEDAANADPARNPDCLPADRVRRLNRQ